MIRSRNNAWWRHQMETFSALLAICGGNSPTALHKGQRRGALMFTLIYAWVNAWVNNGEAGIWDAIAPIMTSLQWLCAVCLAIFLREKHDVTSNLPWKTPQSLGGLMAQSIGTVRCGHAPFIFFALLSIFRDKLPNSKRIVLVPKSYIEIDLNFLT